jgi:hypothetical protein
MVRRKAVAAEESGAARAVEEADAAGAPAATAVALRKAGARVWRRRHMVVDGWGWGLSAAAEVEMDGRTVDNRDIRRGRKLVAQTSPTFKRRNDGRRAEDGRRGCGRMRAVGGRTCAKRCWTPTLLI